MTLFRIIAATLLLTIGASKPAAADLLFVDSFDHYATAETLQKWTTRTTGGASGSMVIAANGRNATNSMRMQSGAGFSGGPQVVKSLSPGSATVILGFAVTFSANPVATATFASVRDGSTDQLSLTMKTDGNIELRRGTSGGTLLATGTSALSTGTYYYIELKALIANSGTYEVRVNGVSAFSGSADTQNTANASWSQIALGRNVGAGASGGNWDYDDLYVADSTGSTNNDLLGAIRVKTILPDGAGNSTDFTPSAGSNFQNVDEASTDGDTTYNSETATGDHDTYTYGSVGFTGTVLGVQTNLLVRSAGVGGETIRPKIRIGSTDYNGTSVAITTSYLDYLEIFGLSPATSSAWTIAEIDGAEFGIELLP
jgi:hypothetical protein